MRFLLTAVLSLLIALPQVCTAKPFATVSWKTTQGARVVFYQAMEVPMLDISIAFAAGSAHDEAHYGLSTLTTRLLNQGNNGLNAKVIAEKLSDTGAQYTWENNRDMVVLSLKTLTTEEPLKEATNLLAQIISHPDFPQDAFNREKNQQLMAIAQALQSPDEVANQTFFKALYQQHPYAHPVNGDNEHVNALTIEQVRHFYQQFFVNNNAVIVMVGAIDEAKAHQIAEQLTRDLPQGQVAPLIPRARPLTKAMDLTVPFPSSQAVLRLGQVGIDHQNPNYFPLMVGNYILGGSGLISQLALELREKRGLTYGVYSQFSPMSGLGPFLISFSTKNQQAASAIEMTRTTLSSFLKTGPNEQELTAAKNYLTGSFPLSLASNSNIADMLLKIAFYHLPDDYLDTYIRHINAVTIEQIKQAFAQSVTPKKLLQVSVGKA